MIDRELWLRNKRHYRPWDVHGHRLFHDHGFGSNLLSFSISLHSDFSLENDNEHDAIALFHQRAIRVNHLSRGLDYMIWDESRFIIQTPHMASAWRKKKVINRSHRRCFRCFSFHSTFFPQYHTFTTMDDIQSTEQDMFAFDKGTNTFYLGKTAYGTHIYSGEALQVRKRVRSCLCKRQRLTF
jgi:hypothetical protein